MLRKESRVYKQLLGFVSCLDSSLFKGVWILFGIGFDLSFVIVLNPCLLQKIYLELVHQLEER